MKTKLLVVVSLCLLALVSASTASAQVSCAGVPAFASCTAYANGASVTYNGSKYTTIAPIPNNRDCPPNSPYNPSTDNWWVNNGTCSSATATPTTGATATRTATATARTGATATRTNTATATSRTGATATRTPTARAATATRTSTATATPTTGTGGNTAYQANYWTQNNDPCTNNGPAGSGEEWTSIGACGSQPAWVASTAYTGGAQVCRNCGGTNPTPTTGGTATPTGATPTPTNGATATPTTGATATATATGPGGGGRKRSIYFEQWGIYARGCTIPGGCLPTASQIERVYYAFNNPNGGGGKAQFGVNQAGVGDQWADYGQPQNGEVYNAPLKGNFNSIKVHGYASKASLSVGGWTWSDGFYSGATSANRVGMVSSYIDAVVRGNIPNVAGQGGPGTMVGVFSGIDLDWEYPGVCGNNPSCGASSADKANQTLLVQEFRRQINSAAPGLILSAAVAAGRDKLVHYDIPGFCASMDIVNLMTYDYFGAWAPQGPTAPHSPLTQFAGQSGLAAPLNDYYTASTVDQWAAAGCPRSKLRIGVGTYGRGWNGSFTGNGLNQPATGPAPGTYEAGVDDYKVLVGSCPSNNTGAGTAWCNSGGRWYSYDTPSTASAKASWAVGQGLGGTFVWAASGDPSDALWNALQ